jgi:small subunit ribosomal protein S16
MVKLRLTRTGKSHAPHYRIVATDSRSPRDGKFIEILGYYNPRTNPSTVTLEKEAIEKWLKDGAQPTPTVKALLVKQGVIKMEKKDSAPKSKKASADEPKKEVEVKAAKKPAAKKTTKKAAK